MSLKKSNICIFFTQSGKIYTWQKFFTQTCLWCLWQIKGMLFRLSVLQFWLWLCYNFVFGCITTFKFDASGGWSGGAGVGSGSYPSLEREHLHLFTGVSFWTLNLMIFTIWPEYDHCHSLAHQLTYRQDFKKKMWKGLNFSRPLCFYYTAIRPFCDRRAALGGNWGF